MPNESLTREILGNIDGLSRWLFYALAAAASLCFAHGLYRRARVWAIGRPAPRLMNRRGSLTGIVRDVLFQRRMRSSRPAAGIAHRLLVSGFAVLLLGTILIAIEHYGATLLGRGAGEPLFHKGVYYAAYEIILDTFGLALLAGCAWFLRRRMSGQSSMDHRRSDWFVLGALISLGVTGYLVEGLRILREQTPQPGFSYFGLATAQFLKLLGATSRNAAAVHLALWWFHALVALALIAVLPRTRLLHAMAGMRSLAARRQPLGVLVPIMLEEVEETGRVGAGKIQDFTRNQLLQLDACVSCGRCQDVCPAYEAGKPLSPRNVVQDLRKHLDVVASAESAKQARAGASGRSDISLHAEVIANETIWSCTSCHACADQCPLGVDPLELIIEMRRNLVAEGQLRGAAAMALQKTQRSGNPWGLPPAERLDWAAGLTVPTAESAGDFDVLYWVGCAAAFDRRAGKVARAVVTLLHAAGVKFAVLGPEERCNGETARRMGDEFLFQELAQRNLEVLARRGVTKIVTHCPHCMNSFKNDYPQFGGRFEVAHHTEFLAQLLDTGTLPIPEPSRGGRKWTLHDPCYLARVGGITQAPRRVLQAASGAGDRLVEMRRRGCNTACCGAGGGRMWFDDAPAERIGRSRIDEALQTAADTVAVACPFCLIMLGDGVAARGTQVAVKDIAEILLDALPQHGSHDD